MKILRKIKAALRIISAKECVVMSVHDKNINIDMMAGNETCSYLLKVLTLSVSLQIESESAVDEANKIIQS